MLSANVFPPRSIVLVLLHKLECSVHIRHDGEQQDDPAESLTVKMRGNEVIVHVTQHAMQRMAARRISTDEMLDVLEFPSDRTLETQEGRKRYGRQDALRRRRLDVVFVEAADGSITVISTFWVP